MTQNEELKNLVKCLEELANKHNAEAKNQENNFLRGHIQGYASAYELCAKWINEILEK